MKELNSHEIKAVSGGSAIVFPGINIDITKAIVFTAMIAIGISAAVTFSIFKQDGGIGL